MRSRRPALKHAKQGFEPGVVRPELPGIKQFARLVRAFGGQRKLASAITARGCATSHVSVHRWCTSNGKCKPNEERIALLAVILKVPCPKLERLFFHDRGTTYAEIIEALNHAR